MLFMLLYLYVLSPAMLVEGSNAAWKYLSVTEVAFMSRHAYHQW